MLAAHIHSVGMQLKALVSCPQYTGVWFEKMFRISYNLKLNDILLYIVHTLLAVAVWHHWQSEHEYD
jgi:hypothetical protein